MCGIVSLLNFVISKVIQLSDIHSSHIYLAVLFPHKCYSSYSLTLYCTVSHVIVDWTLGIYCIALHPICICCRWLSCDWWYCWCTCPGSDAVWRSVYSVFLDGVQFYSMGFFWLLFDSGIMPHMTHPCPSVLLSYCVVHMYYV